MSEEIFIVAVRNLEGRFARLRKGQYISRENLELAGYKVDDLILQGKVRRPFNPQDTAETPEPKEEPLGLPDVTPELTPGLDAKPTGSDGEEQEPPAATKTAAKKAATKTAKK